jgi:hypothetical protein
MLNDDVPSMAQRQDGSTAKRVEMWLHGRQGYIDKQYVCDVILERVQT